MTYPAARGSPPSAGPSQTSSVAAGYTQQSIPGSASWTSSPGGPEMVTAQSRHTSPASRLSSQPSTGSFGLYDSPRGPAGGLEGPIEMSSSGAQLRSDRTWAGPSSSAQSSVSRPPLAPRASDPYAFSAHTSTTSPPTSSYSSPASAPSAYARERVSASQSMSAMGSSTIGLKGRRAPAPAALDLSTRTEPPSTTMPLLDVGSNPSRPPRAPGRQKSMDMVSFVGLRRIAMTLTPQPVPRPLPTAPSEDEYKPPSPVLRSVPGRERRDSIPFPAHQLPTSSSPSGLLPSSLSSSIGIDTRRQSVIDRRESVATNGDRVS